MGDPRKPRDLESTDPARRRFLVRSATAALGGALVVIGGCRPDGGVDDAVRIPLSSLPEGEPVEVVVIDEPVHLLRQGDTVTALSRWCSHMGCRVGWNSDERLYECPCHEGRFDRSGEVVSGPPTSPLRSFPARVEGDEVVVEAPDPENR